MIIVIIETPICEARFTNAVSRFVFSALVNISIFELAIPIIRMNIMRKIKGMSKTNTSCDTHRNGDIPTGKHDIGNTIKPKR